MDKEKQKRFLEGIQKRSKRNIEFSVYKYIEKRFIIIPKEYSKGQLHLANKLISVDISNISYDRIIKQWSRYLNTKNHFWFLGMIDLCKEIALDLT